MAPTRPMPLTPPPSRTRSAFRSVMSASRPSRGLDGGGLHHDLAVPDMEGVRPERDAVRLPDGECVVALDVERRHLESRQRDAGHELADRAPSRRDAGDV